METNQATFSSLYFIKNANKYTDNPKEDIRNYLPTDAVLMWFAAGGNHSGLGKAEREREPTLRSKAPARRPGAAGSAPGRGQVECLCAKREKVLRPVTSICWGNSPGTGVYKQMVTDCHKTVWVNTQIYDVYHVSSTLGWQQPSGVRWGCHEQVQLDGCREPHPH